MGGFSDGAIHNSVPPSPPRWKGVQSLDLVHQLNERCIGLLCELAADTHQTNVPVITENRDLWSGLTTEARQKAAGMPFVIMDAQFKDETWWRRVAAAPSSETPVEESPQRPVARG